MSDSILIIGAGGFVGTALTRTLVARGKRVIALCRRPSSPPPPNVEVAINALTRPDQLEPLLERSRLVIYVAAHSTPGSSAGRPLDELHHDLEPLLVLLQALQNSHKPDLIYLSSGGSLYTSAPNESVLETSPIQPRSYHGAGKAAAEHFISAWCSQYDGSAIILRPSNIYGPGQVEREGFGIIPACFGKVRRAETLHVWGDGSAVRDYLYIDDFVDLCVAIIDIPIACGASIFNASSGHGTSLDELFATVEAVSGMSLSRTYDPGRAVDVARVVMDASLAKQHFGWCATTSLHDGLEKTWRWFNTTPR